MVLHSPNLAECVELPVFAGCTDEKYQDRPTRRSGYRSFVDGDFLYVVGGCAMINVDDDGPSVLREVWRYNLWTHVWDDVPVDENFPTALLSFSLAITKYGSPQAVIFGGTDFPIGEASSNNEVHIVTVLDDSVHTVKLRVVGTKAATYGQAMCHSSTDPDTFFVVGGTKGREFFQDVHSLKKEASGQWHWRKLTPFMPTLDGLYRMEVVQHRRRLLLFFGGGTRNFVRRFEKMSKTLFENNACRSCSLNFGTVYDLIAHFELEHLPAFEMAEDRRRREDDGGGNTRVANLPLSYYFRLFPQPYRPTPRAPDNVRLSFCHYKKKVAAPAIDTSEHLMGTITTGSTPVKNKPESKPIEEEDDSNADLEEADPNDPTVSSRYRCQLRSCGKQFKNMNGVRHHMEIAHGGRVEEGASSSTSTPAVANGNQLQQSTVSRARSYSTLKCPQCNKRCKSQSALNTHMMKEHMKTEANPLATPAPAVSVSPVVVERPSSQPPPMSSAPIRPVASQPHLSSTVQQQPQQQQQQPQQSNHHHQHHKSQSHANDQTMKSYAVGTQQQHQQQQQQNQPQTPQQQQQPIFHQPLGPQSFHYHPQQGGELQHYQQNPVTTQQHVSHHRGQHYQVSGSGHGYQAAGAVLHAELQRRGSLQGRNSGYGQSTASPPVTQSHLQRPASRGLESNR